MDMFHLKEDRTLRPWAVRMGETLFDIALNAQHLSDEHQIEIDDSRELFTSALVWTREFEAAHKDPWDEESGTADYLSAIDDFAMEKLLGQFGRHGAPEQSVEAASEKADVAHGSANRSNGLSRTAEFQHIVSFIEAECFDVEICCRQLRSLWTAYCLHNSLEPDTSGYDNDVLELWEKMKESEPETAYWSDFDSFDAYLCENLC